MSNPEQDALLNWFERVSYTQAHNHGFIVGAMLREKILSEERLQKEVLAQAELARYDELTGLLNRRGLLESGEEQFERLDHNVAVLFIDLDKFKCVNDTLGHKAGDELLRVAAGTASVNVRGGDLVGRLGGDEFAIIADTTPCADDQLTPLERVTLMAERISGAYTDVTGETMSIGITMFDPNIHTNLADVFETADGNMYVAKASR